MNKVRNAIKLWFWVNVLCVVILFEAIRAGIRREKELHGAGVEALEGLMADTLNKILDEKEG